MTKNLILLLLCLFTNITFAQKLCFDKPEGISNYPKLEGWSYKDFVIPDGYSLDSIYGDFDRPGLAEDKHYFVWGQCANTSIYDENLAALSFYNYDEIEFSLYRRWIRLFPYQPQSPSVIRVYLPIYMGALWHSVCFAISKPEHIGEDFAGFRSKFITDKKFALERTILPVDYVHSEAGSEYFIKWDRTKFEAFFQQLADVNGCSIQTVNDLNGTTELRVWEEKGEVLGLSFVLKEGKFYLYRISKEVS